MTINILPDGSAVSTLSMPLPKDHWLYVEGDNIPPMGFRCGDYNSLRKKLEKAIREAARYAVRASTMNGKIEDFDPDAMVQNMVIGLIGYHSIDGLSSAKYNNPNPIPSEVLQLTRMEVE